MRLPYRILLILLVFCYYHLAVQAQRVGYSASFYADAPQNMLIAGQFNNAIHVWRLDVRRKPTLIRLDSADLHTIDLKDKDLPLHSRRDVTFITFSTFYYAFFRFPRSSTYTSLYKIEADGTMEDQTALLEKIIDNKPRLAPVTITRAGEKICFVSSEFYKNSQAIVHIVEFDSLLNKKNERKGLLDYSRGDRLQQILIASDTLAFVLKMEQKDSLGLSSMTLYSFDWSNGIQRQISYNSDNYLFRGPALYSDPANNTVWLFTQALKRIPEQPNHYMAPHGYLLSFNDTLAELSPGKLIQINSALPSKTARKKQDPSPFQFSQFKIYPAGGFVLVSSNLLPGEPVFSRTYTSNPFSSFGYSPSYDAMAPLSLSRGYNSIPRQSYYYLPQPDSRLRITWVDSTYKILADSIIEKTAFADDVDFANGLIHQDRRGMALLYPVKIKRRSGILRYLLVPGKALEEQLIITDPKAEHSLYYFQKTDACTYLSPYMKKGRYGISRIRF